MADGTRELTFEDLLVLKRIDADTVVERFSSKINASFFEAANLLGKLKLKGYVDIEASPGLSKVWLTEGGKTILHVADARAGEETDNLDLSVLRAISAGSNSASGTSKSLNLRHSDLAFHLYRLLAHDLIDYNMHTSKAGWEVNISLTEAGFNKLGSAPAPEVQPEEQAEKPAMAGAFMNIFKPRQQGAKASAGPGRAPAIAEELVPSLTPSTPSKPLTPEELRKKIARQKKGSALKNWVLYAILAIIVVILAGIVFLYVLPAQR
ncbi:MAG: hypothetical protein WC759_03955 [Candidatus Micrarchaeia archaeon]